MHNFYTRFGEAPPPLAVPGAEEGPPLYSGIDFSACSIQCLVATSLLSAAVILAGITAYSMLPVAALPQGLTLP